MSAIRRKADVFVLLVMLILCAIWGSQQVLLKLTAADMTTVSQLLLRAAIAVLLLLALMLWQGSWRG